MIRSVFTGVVALASWSCSASAQTYLDKNGTIVPAVVPLIGCATNGACSGPVSSSNPLPVSGTFSATMSGFAPGGAYAGPMSISTTSSRTALPVGAVAVIYNTGTVSAYLALGGSSVTATMANDVVAPGSWIAFSVGSNGYLAALTASGATSLNISGGSGLATGNGGGSILPIGSAGAPNVGVLSVQGISGGSGLSTFTSNGALETGGNLAVVANAQGASGSGISQPTGASGSLGWLSGIYKAVAGTLAVSWTGQTVSIANFPSTQAISAGSLPIPTGAASASNQTAVQSAPGTSASTALTIQGAANGVSIPASDSNSAAFAGAISMTVGTTYTAQRSVGVLATAAGNVVFQFSDASTLTLPVAVGWQTFPFACTQIVLPGTTATGSYFNLK